MIHTGAVIWVQPGNAFAKNERGSLIALAHPVAVAALVLWIANDHIFKARFGNDVTGKLSDVAGLVVFPLILAAMLSWWSRRPMAIATAFTVLLYGSINLFSWADAGAESVMSVFVNSELTRDPSDLVLLPLLAVPWRLWHLASVAGPQKLRRTWSHALLAVGLATTLATSAAGRESETFSGTVLLTEAQPRIEIPIALTLDDEPAASSEAVYASVSTTFFGSGDSPQGTAVSATVVDGNAENDVSDVVVIELDDVAWAPVEVAWKINAYTEGDPGNILNPFNNGSEAAEPLLTVDAPRDSFGPEPIASTEVPAIARNADLRFAVFEFKVTVPEIGADVRVNATSEQDRWPEPISIATEDERIAFRTHDTTLIPTPRSCATAPCTFSVWVQTATFDAGNHIELHGDPDLQVEIVEHELMRTRQTVQIDRVELDGLTAVELAVEAIVGRLADDPVARLNHFVQAELDPEPLFSVSSGSFDFDECCWAGAAIHASGVGDPCCEWQLFEPIGAEGITGEVQIEVHFDQYTLPGFDPEPLQVGYGEISTENWQR